jgi:UDP-glucuronate 4-epimerase
MLEPTIDIASQRVLVTGAAGFIGSHLTERLLSLGANVTGLDNFDPFYDRRIKERNLVAALADRRFRFVEGDIRDSGLIATLFSEASFPVVVHLAALAGVRPSIEAPARYADVNVTGTVVLLEEARKHEVKHFVIASSSSVYGDRKEIPFRETDNVDRPFSPYAATKKACELISATYNSIYAMPVTCVRFFTVYGPRQRPEMAISKFARLMLEGKPIPMFGDGSMARDFTFCEDIIDGVASICSRPHGYEVVNVGGSRITTLAEMIASLGRALGIEPIIERKPLQAGDVTQTLADVSKAHDLYGYTPNYPLDKGLAAFAEWLRSAPV